MLSAWLAEAKAQGVKTELAAKTWDLKSAYKQLPLSDAAFDRDSFFVIFDPRIRKPAVFKQRALPFGSRASVTAFIRSALGVWTVAVKLLFLVWSVMKLLMESYRALSLRFVQDLVISVFFRLLGGELSTLWNFLKVIVPVSFPETWVRTALSLLTPPLSLMATVVWGASATMLNVRSLAGFRRLDASFEPDGYSGLGGICYDAQCKILSWFSAPVPNDLLKILKNCFGTVRETVIYELEALAVVVALELFKKHLCRRNVVVYTDNSGVHGTFVKCWSENVAGGALAFMAAKLEFDLQAFFYYDRVPPYSNPADAPSRGILHQDACLRAECTADVLVEALKCGLRE
eukprot:s10472_g1.t1